MGKLVLNDTERRVKSHCDERYSRTLGKRLKKLGEEFGELVEAVFEGDRAHVAEEAADMAILLIDIAQLNGCRSGSLEMHIIEKLITLRHRPMDPDIAP